MLTGISSGNSGSHSLAEPQTFFWFCSSTRVQYELKGMHMIWVDIPPDVIWMDTPDNIIFILMSMNQHQTWKVFYSITNTLITHHIWLVMLRLQLNCPRMSRKLSSAVAFQSKSKTEKTCEDTEPCVDNQIFRITKCYASVAPTESVIKQLLKNNFP